MGTNSRFIGIAIREADKQLYDWYKAQPGKPSDVGRDMVEIAQMFNGKVELAIEAHVALTQMQLVFGANWQKEWAKFREVAEAM